MKARSIFALAAAAMGLVLAASQAPAQTARRDDGPPKPPPIVAGAYWHDVTMNVADPEASIAFYTTHFKAVRATYDGQPAVWTQKSWLIFHKADGPVSKKLNTAIWHIGWGAPDPKSEYRRQQSLGATFFTPLTDIAENNGGTLDRFYYMYVQDPDRGLIELNTARSDNFGHVHLLSEDPITTGDWYMRVFGFSGRALATPTTPSRDARFGKNGRQIGPSSSLNLDNVNLIIYPAGYARFAYRDDWAGIDHFQSTRGRLHDHLGIGVPSLDRALAALKRVGITPTEPPGSEANGQIRYAWIEGPDHIAIQLVEDHSPHPPES